MIKDFSATLVAKKNLSKNIFEFTFEILEDSLDFVAGQYLLLKIEDKFRQYSISSSALQKNTFQLTIELIEGGLASTYLSALNVGEKAGFKGPAGVFTLQDTDRDKIFLVTGTGVAPVKSMIETYLEGPGIAKLLLFFGLRSREDIYFFEEFKALAESHENFDFDICLTREESLAGLDSQHFAQGRVHQVCDVFIEDSGSNINDYEYYLCGSRTIVESLKEYAIKNGIAKENLFFENFG